MNVTLGHFIEHDENNRDEFVEFTFWGLARWHSTQSIDSNNYLYINPTTGAVSIPTQNLYSTFPFDVSGFNEAGKQTIYESSQFNNFESQLSLESARRPTGLFSNRADAGGGNVNPASTCPISLAPASWI